MNSLSIFGTSSDAGKSTIALFLTYILHKKGIRVAPFKAQNVSNNSYVTDIKAGEIAIPQGFCAEAIGLKTKSDFNPVLLKSGAYNKAHMIINGKSMQDTDVKSYYKNIEKLQPIVSSAFERLQVEFECIVAEGAGSPVELNLMEKDLSNIYIADKFNTKIILVADIQRGGVFASIYGVYNLLPKKLRKNVIGVIVNKFQGDMSLFNDGVDIIENEFCIPVLGVVPFKAFNLGFEDSASLIGYTQKLDKSIIKVGVIKFPHISNFTDFEPLIADEEIELRFISSISELSSCNLIILPGTKRVFDDLLWLKNNGFYEKLKSKELKVVAICGGYEMMFETISDPFGLESDKEIVNGIGRFKGEVVFQKEKIVKKGCYNLFGIMANGYEIHNGTTKKNAKMKKNIYGTFVHGIFDNNQLRYKIFSEINDAYIGYDFQFYKENSIKEYAQFIQKHIKIDKILSHIS